MSQMLTHQNSADQNWLESISICRYMNDFFQVAKIGFSENKHKQI